MCFPESEALITVGPAGKVSVLEGSPVYVSKLLITVITDIFLFCSGVTADCSLDILICACIVMVRSWETGTLWLKMRQIWKRNQACTLSQEDHCDISQYPLVQNQRLTLMMNSLITFRLVINCYMISFFFCQCCLRAGKNKLVSWARATH